MEKTFLIEENKVYHQFQYSTKGCAIELDNN